MKTPKAVDHLCQLLLRHDSAYLAFDVQEAMFVAYRQPPKSIYLDLIGLYTPSIHRNDILADIESYRAERAKRTPRYVSNMRAN